MVLVVMVLVVMVMVALNIPFTDCFLYCRRKSAFNKGDPDIDQSGDGSSLQKVTIKKPRRRKSAQRQRRGSSPRKAKALDENII